jgi:hypothetical protein
MTACRQPLHTSFAGFCSSNYYLLIRLYVQYSTVSFYYRICGSSCPCNKPGKCTVLFYSSWDLICQNFHNRSTLISRTESA